MKTVIGLFDAASDAYSTRNDLIAAGVAQSNISVVTGNTTVDLGTQGKTEAAEGAGIGATAGAIAGGAAGLLAWGSLIAIPGIGGLLALGPIVALLTGAGVGAAAGGLIGGLIGLGIPEHEAEVYAEGISRGGTLLSVQIPDGDADRTAMIMSQHNAVDIDRRSTEWESKGWTRKYPRPVGPSPTGPAPSSTVTGGTVTDPRARGVDRPGGTMGNEPEPVRRPTSARIYNP